MDTAVDQFEADWKAAVAAARAAVIPATTLAEALAPAGEVPTKGAARRNALLKLAERRDANCGLERAVRKAARPLRTAQQDGAALTPVELNIAKLLTKQSEVLSRWNTENTSLLDADITKAVPSSIVEAETRLRGLQPVLGLQEIADALQEIATMKRSASWAELAAWSLEITVKL
jgi:hypothetical protein